MISSCYLVVPVCFNALKCILRIKFVLIHQLLIDHFIDWHLLLSWKESLHALVPHLSVPHMVS